MTAVFLCLCLCLCLLLGWLAWLVFWPVKTGREERGERRTETAGDRRRYWAIRRQILTALESRRRAGNR